MRASVFSAGARHAVPVALRLLTGLVFIMSDHGPRKAAARWLAKAGCSNQITKAWTGHTADSEVARYTAAANQQLLSAAAGDQLMANRREGLANVSAKSLMHLSTAFMLPISTAAHRLVLAPGVAEADDVGAFFKAYDADAPRRLKLLAVVMTMRFDHDVMVHDMLSAVGGYAEILARQHRLSSLVVCHRPGDGLSARAPHAHVLCLSRTHRPGGFAEQNAMFKGEATDLHLNFMEEWRSFRRAWERIGSA